MMNFKLLLPRTVKCCRCMSTKSRRSQTPAEYCLDLVKRNDYENFLCSLLLPPGIRSAAFAIRAFNVEVAQVEDQVSDSKIGAMRFKFWEESLNEIYKDNPTGNPVSLELHRVLRKHKLSKRYFKRLIDARLEKLSTSVFPDLESLEKYSENAFSSIFYLLLEAQQIQNLHADHASSHLGKACGILTLVRSVPYNSLQKRVLVLPQDVLLKHEVSTESVFRGRSNKDLSDCVFEVCSRAKQHLDKARSLSKDVPKEVRLTFLPARIVDIYLEKLRQVDFDVFHPSLQQRNNMLPFRLLRSRYFSRSY